MSFGKRNITTNGAFGFLFPLACLLSTPADAASWIVNLDRHGLPELSIGGATAISSNFVFWGPNAAWTFFPNQRQVIAPYEYSISGADKALNFTLNGHVTRPSEQQLVWQFDLDAGSTTQTPLAAA